MKKENVSDWTNRAERPLKKMPRCSSCHKVFAVSTNRVFST